MGYEGFSNLNNGENNVSLQWVQIYARWFSDHIFLSHFFFMHILPIPNHINLSSINFVFNNLYKWFQIVYAGWKSPYMCLNRLIRHVSFTNKMRQKKKKIELRLESQKWLNSHEKDAIEIGIDSWRTSTTSYTFEESIFQNLAVSFGRSF